VDHHVFQSADGAWHLWGCIRGTSVGRILYHWEGSGLTQTPWHPTGKVIRVDRTAGESINDRDGREWIQSPFVVRYQNTHYMFYGGHSTGLDANGTPVPRGDARMESQMCLMTSPDGRAWNRYRAPSSQRASGQAEAGLSRVFAGPGETRDPCLLRVGDVWLLYYAGYHGADRWQAGFYVRTSKDLVHWSDWRLVHQDGAFGSGRWETECPHVVRRGDAYYLFRTQNYASAKTHVFRSEDAFDFGIGDASAKYVGPIGVAAPEIVVDADGSEYITSNHDFVRGTLICRLRWEPG
jgi:beta-fructofuranosidase